MNTEKLKKERLEVAKEVIERKIMELSKKKVEIELSNEFNQIEKGSFSSINFEIELLSKQRKQVMDELKEIIDKECKELIINHILDTHTQIIETKHEEYYGIGGQCSQVSYSYEVKEK